MQIAENQHRKLFVTKKFSIKFLLRPAQLSTWETTANLCVCTFEFATISNCNCFFICFTFILLLLLLFGIHFLLRRRLYNFAVFEVI